MNNNVGAIHESPDKDMFYMNKVLVYFCLGCLFISPVLGQEFGSTNINSVPDSADVYVDGYYFGKTPFIQKNIIPGTYQLKLKHQGYDSTLIDMNIEKGKRLAGKITLKKSNDSLHADSTALKPKDIPILGEFVEYSIPPQFKEQKKFSWSQLNDLNIPEGMEGRVLLNLLVNYDGTVMDAGIAKSSGSFCLDYKALKASYRLTFYPAQDKDKKPARAWIIYPVAFIKN
jgi:TonB family protein